MSQLPSSRVRFPDEIRNHVINPRWMQYKPLFCMCATFGMQNIMNGEMPSPIVTNWPTYEVSLAGRCFANDGTSNIGFRYNREAYKAGSNHTVFMVVESSASPTGGSPLMGNGTSSGVNKPFNYRLLIDPGVTRGIRWLHDTGPTAVQDDFDLPGGIVMRSGEPSTVSISALGTHLDQCIDGITSTYTMGTAAASNTEGNFDLFINTGSSTSFNGKIYMTIVFDEYIPNDVLFELHARPQDFFMPRPVRLGAVVGAAPAVDTAKNLLLLGVG